jgi:hypothetical protein
MADKVDVLLELYKEHCNWERHHESQRSSVSSILIAIAAGIIGIVTFDGHLNIFDIPLTVLLIVLGCFGSLFSAKQYNSFSLHQQRANKIRDALNTFVPDANILILRKEADIMTKNNFPIITRMRLYHFWNTVPVLIVIIGIILTICACQHWFENDCKDHEKNKGVEKKSSSLDANHSKIALLER